MKTFENIKTTVELKDTNILNSLELNILFPKDNQSIVDFIKCNFNDNYKVISNFEDVGIYKTNITFDNKNAIEILIQFLTDLDNKYANRNILIEDFNKLLD
jgi:competence transcription factor ComK